MFSQPASLELTHNWGTESDANFKGYHSGNDEPKGYGTLQCIVIIGKTYCSRMQKCQVTCLSCKRGLLCLIPINANEG